MGFHKRLIVVTVVCLGILAFTSANAGAPIEYLDRDDCDVISGWAGDLDTLNPNGDDML